MPLFYHYFSTTLSNIAQKIKNTAQSANIISQKFITDVYAVLSCIYDAVMNKKQ